MFQKPIHFSYSLLTTIEGTGVTSETKYAGSVHTQTDQLGVDEVGH